MIKNALVVYTIPRTKEQKLALESVKNILEKNNVRFSMANRDKLEKLQLRNRDMIIAVGGDGTFLRAAHFIGSQPILGVNSDTKDKEGFFMKADRNDFESKFKRIIGGDFKIKKLQRLEAHIDGKKIGALALNEFFIGARKSYHAAKYTIKAGNKKERQKSSGILITTPAGSHAWAKSCSGKTMPLDSKNYQFVVREPYQRNVFKNYKIKYGLLKRRQSIFIMSEMIDGVIVADSVGKEHKFKNKSTAEIRISDKPLNAIWV